MNKQRAKVKFYADLLGQYENKLLTFNVENLYRAYGLLMKFVLKGNFIKKAYYLPFANLHVETKNKDESWSMFPEDELKKFNNWDFSEIKKRKSDLKTL